jgi:hypothetical protein
LALRLTILQILVDCGRYLLPEPSLLQQTQLLLPVSKTEFDEALKWLSNEDYVAGITPELGGPHKWKVTDAGRIAAVRS